MSDASADDDMHPKTRTVLETVRDRPGVHTGGVARVASLPVSTARYHLERLVRQGRLDAESFGQYRSFYPPRLQDPAERRALHHLNREVAGRILRYLAAHGTCRQGDLVVSLDRGASTISHHLRNLQDAGLVTHHRVSPVEYRLTQPDLVHAVIRRHPRIWDPCCEDHPRPPSGRGSNGC